PWIDRGAHRTPTRRRAVITTVIAGFVGVVALTALGWRDRPLNAELQEGWGVRAIGGRMMAANAGCTKCHAATGAADPLEGITVTRGKDWLSGHMVDPEMIAPGLREPPRTLNERQVAAIVAYVDELSQQPYPGFPPEVETASAIFARYCIGCHRLGGDGGDEGPDLTKAGAKHDTAALRTWIADPEAVDPEADMPAFADRLTSEQLDIIARYLAGRK
ncbi:MAG TPA: c-type cytochrome, partial [Vicinamibacterales bacterium]|nr:c-type cytochrome [Vicinamibacterales bacterium]